MTLNWNLSNSSPVMSSFPIISESIEVLALWIGRYFKIAVGVPSHQFKTLHGQFHYVFSYSILVCSMDSPIENGEQIVASHDPLDYNWLWVVLALGKGRLATTTYDTMVFVSLESGLP